ncbi:MAG: MFS transporter [Myxococcales bacterium]|nr:MFS transporter [Myxococcales bacterium]
MRTKTSALWYVLGLLALANFLHYANRNVVVTMYDDLRRTFDFDNGELGLLTTVFMIAHAPATVFFGWLSDRVSRQRVLAAGLLVWSVSATLTALADGLLSMLALRALVGLGAAACVPVANALICDFVPPERKARAVAVFNLGLFFGGAAGTVVGKKLGFPPAFLVLGIPGLAVAVLVLRLRLGVSALGPLEGQGPVSEVEGRQRSKGAIRFLLGISTYRWTVAGAVFMAFSAGGYVAWFFDFLQGSKGADENEALFILGVSLVTGLGGVLAGGWVGDRLLLRIPHGRQAAAAIGIAASVPLALAVIFLPLGAGFYVAAWLLMFTINWYHGPLVALVDDLVPSEEAGLAQGLYIAAMHLCGTAPASSVVGWLAERHSLWAALLLPTSTMVLAALCFVASFAGTKGASVVQR